MSIADDQWVVAVCHHCERVRLNGKDYFQAEHRRLELAGASMEICPECAARQAETAAPRSGERKGE